MTLISNETLYLVLIGALSAIVAWIIISVIKYTYRIIKDFTSDIKQVKKEVEELKVKVKALEDKTGDEE